MDHDYAEVRLRAPPECIEQANPLDTPARAAEGGIVQVTAEEQFIEKFGEQAVEELFEDFYADRAGEKTNRFTICDVHQQDAVNYLFRASGFAPDGNEYLVDCADGNYNGSEIRAFEPSSFGGPERERPGEALGMVEGVGMADAVNHPAHYNTGKIECIDYIEDQNLGFHEANAVKYIARARHKGTELQDLRKAAWYLQRKINLLTGLGAKEASDATD